MANDLIYAYKLLGIDYRALPTSAIIHRGFREKAQFFHPDKQVNASSNEAKEKAVRLQELTDAKTRILETASAVLKTWLDYTSQNTTLTIKDKVGVSELLQKTQECLHSYLSKTLGVQYQIPDALTAKYNQKTAMWELPAQVKLSEYPKEQRANILLWLVTYSEANMLSSKFSLDSTNVQLDITEEFLISILQNSVNLKSAFNRIAVAVNAFNIKMISSSLFKQYVQYCGIGSIVLMVALDFAALISYWPTAGILFLGYSFVPNIFNFINQKRVERKYKSKDPVFIASKLQEDSVGKLLTLIAYSATTIAAILSLVLFGPIAGIIYVPLLPLMFSNILTCIVVLTMGTPCYAKFGTENIHSVLVYKDEIIKRLGAITNCIITESKTADLFVKQPIRVISAEATVTKPQEVSEKLQEVANAMAMRLGGVD